MDQPHLGQQVAEDAVTLAERQEKLHREFVETSRPGSLSHDYHSKSAERWKRFREYQQRLQQQQAKQEQKEVERRRPSKEELRRKALDPAHLQRMLELDEKSLVRSEDSEERRYWQSQVDRRKKSLRMIEAQKQQ